MCGIVGYVGHRPALGVVVEALRRMEYRGYDSAGIAILDGAGSTAVERKAGRLSNLEAELDEIGADKFVGTTGMGHTRWATHGRPTDRNAHPHRDASGAVSVLSGASTAGTAGSVVVSTGAASGGAAGSVSVGAG